MKKIAMTVLCLAIIAIIIWIGTEKKEFSNPEKLTVRQFLLSRGVVIDGPSPKFERVYAKGTISSYPPFDYNDPQNTLWRSGDAYFLFTGDYALDCHVVSENLSGDCGSKAQ